MCYIPNVVILHWFKCQFWWWPLLSQEVILSFLGFGVPVGVVSMGQYVDEAQSELILGKWWQLAAASVAMAVLVTAFSMFTDALRDALDPKLKYGA